MADLKVTAALVTAVVENGRVVYLYKGDVVPDGVTKESLDNLKSLGFVAEDEGDEKPARKTSK